MDNLFKIELANKYNISEGIFDEKNLILEGIIDSVSEEDEKRYIMISLKMVYQSLDNEMIKNYGSIF